MGGPGLLTIPRELRDQIYGHYFELEGGYTLNPSTNKLVSVDSQPIDLSLRLVNLQISKETRGIAFTHNDIHFVSSSSWDRKENWQRGRFDYLLKKLSRIRAWTLSSAIKYLNSLPPIQRKSGIRAEIPKRFTQFLNTDERLFQEKIAHDISGCGEVPSSTREFIERELRWLLYNAGPPFKESRGFQTLVSLFPCIDAWHIPEVQDVKALESGMSSLPPETTTVPRQVGFWTEEQHRCSAASLAIKFLQSLQKSTKTMIRRIVLHEDRVSIAWPECHARGLIGYCKQYPLLRVERRVSLWRNVFPAGSHPLEKAVNDPTNQLQPPVNQERLERLCGEHISDSLARWIMEALKLPSLGMPEGSFTLILDGGPIPEKTSEVFNVALEDAAWQSAFVEQFPVVVPENYGLYDKHVTNSFDPQELWMSIRQSPVYVMTGFPEAMRDIACNTSLVKCNFPIGSTMDDNGLRKRYESMALPMWDEIWKMRFEKALYDTAPPLPSWIDLRREDTVPEVVRDARPDSPEAPRSTGEARRREIEEDTMYARWGESWYNR